MVTGRYYIRAYRNEFADPDCGTPFIISIADGTVYASRDLTARQLHELRRDIDNALEDGMVEMERGDLYGSPDDIEF